MANAVFKIIRELINTPYATYMAVAGLTLAVSNYDTYHMNKITHDLAAKYNPACTTYITVKNILMCPVGRCNIYSVNKATENREFIASEIKVIIPPIIKVWNDEFYVKGTSES